jgi:hypothetical protein
MLHAIRFVLALVAFGALGWPVMRPGGLLRQT